MFPRCSPRSNLHFLQRTAQVEVAGWTAVLAVVVVVAVVLVVLARTRASTFKMVIVHDPPAALTMKLAVVRLMDAVVAAVVAEIKGTRIAIMTAIVDAVEAVMTTCGAEMIVVMTSLVAVLFSRTRDLPFSVFPNCAAFLCSAYLLIFHSICLYLYSHRALGMVEARWIEKD